MNRITMFRGVAVAAAFLFSLGSEALAQQPGTGVSMFCKTWAGGKGFVLVTLSNLTTSTIPKGETLFASKGGKTIKFQAAEAIPDGGTRPTARAPMLFRSRDHVMAGTRT